MSFWHNRMYINSALNHSSHCVLVKYQHYCMNHLHRKNIIALFEAVPWESMGWGVFLDTLCISVKYQAWIPYLDKTTYQKSVNAHKILVMNYQHYYLVVPETSIYIGPYPAAHGLETSIYICVNPAAHGLETSIYIGPYRAAHRLETSIYISLNPAAHGLETSIYIDLNPAAHRLETSIYIDLNPAAHGLETSIYIDLNPAAH